MKNFIAIENRFFRLQGEDPKTTDFHIMGTEGFTIYTYLILMQGNRVMCQVSLKMIQSFFGDNIKGIKDTRTIKKYLKMLHKNKYIEILNIKDIIKNKEENKTNKLHLNDIMNIKVNKGDLNNGFTAMPEELFIREISNIGHIGWSILCLLTNLHNINYGDTYMNIGFANPSQEYLSLIFNLHYKTIAEYCNILEVNKLINIEVQTPIVKGYNKENEPIYEFTSNHYIVKFKYNNKNEYYIGHNDQNYSNEENDNIEENNEEENNNNNEDITSW